jgi:dinuclear metal center YbgI/SA1388 family protein
MPESGPASRPGNLALVPKLSDVVTALERIYHPDWAESWDAVGLVCGDPDADVRSVMFAVDPTRAVADEALARGADLLVTHHPLFLRGVHSVAATGFKGRVVHSLITGGCALHVAHTNADSAAPGVSDALAAALGLTVTAPLDPSPADPHACRGIGRIGELATPETLGAFAARAARALPATATGLRIAGDPDRLVRTVAVCGGAGDSLFDAVRRSGADLYVTADLRHHPASEALEHGGPALLDAPHWATEWPWLAYAADELTRALAVSGATVETTDPWTFHTPHHR